MTGFSSNRTSGMDRIKIQLAVAMSSSPFVTMGPIILSETYLLVMDGKQALIDEARKVSLAFELEKIIVEIELSRV